MCYIKLSTFSFSVHVKVSYLVVSCQDLERAQLFPVYNCFHLLRYVTDTTDTMLLKLLLITKTYSMTLINWLCFMLNQWQLLFSLIKSKVMALGRPHATRVIRRAHTYNFTQGLMAVILQTFTFKRLSLWIYPLLRAFLVIIGCVVCLQHHPTSEWHVRVCVCVMLCSVCGQPALSQFTWSVLSCCSFSLFPIVSAAKCYTVCVPLMKVVECIMFPHLLTIFSYFLSFIHLSDDAVLLA